MNTFDVYNASAGKLQASFRVCGQLEYRSLDRNGRCQTLSKALAMSRPTVKDITGSNRPGSDGEDKRCKRVNTGVNSCEQKTTPENLTHPTECIRRTALPWLIK